MLHAFNKRKCKKEGIPQKIFLDAFLFHELLKPMRREVKLSDLGKDIDVVKDLG